MRHGVDHRSEAHFDETRTQAKGARSRSYPSSLPQTVCQDGAGANRLNSRGSGNRHRMLLIVGLLLVLLLFGAGFALHVLWILAALFAIVWLVGVAMGRGESAGTHHFYRW
jgi:hypothetical protein